ncbi:futalosine hydrolase [Taibaiella sp. KBW10]|uniref:futalosine hydrolase n=1 Tax=Taibaiella sp. KBW10 TaxID=2153357 RepID=UPI0013156ABD|nr:futalosine hydrolase [Taibaiella sp. KBW10]
MTHVLIIAATDFEVQGLRNYLSTYYQHMGNHVFKKDKYQITLAYTGIGLVATSYHLSKIIAAGQPDVVVQLGIAGVYQRNMALGTVVQVKHDQIADMGAIAKDGTFLNISAMGLSEPSAALFTTTPPLYFQKTVATLPKALGLSVNCITGKPEQSSLHPTEGIDYDCIIESMEGAAMHYVCAQENIPCLQLRSLSNYVEPRDKSQWQLKLAIDNLNSFALTLLENIP